MTLENIVLKAVMSMKTELLTVTGMFAALIAFIPILFLFLIKKK